MGWFKEEPSCRGHKVIWSSRQFYGFYRHINCKVILILWKMCKLKRYIIRENIFNEYLLHIKKEMDKIKSFNFICLQREKTHNNISKKFLCSKLSKYLMKYLIISFDLTQFLDCEIEKTNLARIFPPRWTAHPFATARNCNVSVF